MNDFQMFLSRDNLKEAVKELVPDILPVDLEALVFKLFEMHQTCRVAGPVYGLRICHSDSDGVRTPSYTEKFESAKVGTYDKVVCVEETRHWFAVGMSFGVPDKRFVSKVQIKKESKPDTVIISTKSCGLIFAGLVLLGALAVAIF